MTTGFVDSSLFVVSCVERKLEDGFCKEWTEKFPRVWAICREHGRSERQPVDESLHCSRVKKAAQRENMMVCHRSPGARAAHPTSVISYTSPVPRILRTRWCYRTLYS